MDHWLPRGFKFKIMQEYWLVVKRNFFVISLQKYERITPMRKSVSVVQFVIRLVEWNSSFILMTFGELSTSCSYSGR